MSEFREKLETARLFGNRYNPNDDESLQKGNTKTILSL